ncbi:MAG: signal peptidase I [Candidatus Levybacteria bacterium]|nr:signal peptidase I [Candidatus Levybacteria bacterium]
MKIVKKTVNVILTLGVFALIPAIVFTLVTSKTNAILGIQSFVVLSGSMEPTIPVGSIIYTQKQLWYPQGSSISFKNGNRTITHRVTKVTNRANTLYYQTKGDANNTVDEKEVIAKDIFGKQVFFLPYAGYLINFLKTPLGFFPIIIFPTVIFIVLELWNLKKEIEKQIEKKILNRMNTT